MSRRKTTWLFVGFGVFWLTVAIILDLGFSGSAWCFGVAWGTWFFHRSEMRDVEKLLARISTKPYADTADVAEARALLALLRGNQDAR